MHSSTVSILKCTVASEAPSVLGSLCTHRPGTKLMVLDHIASDFGIVSPVKASDHVKDTHTRDVHFVDACTLCGHMTCTLWTHDVHFVDVSAEKDLCYAVIMTCREQVLYVCQNGRGTCNLLSDFI